MNEGKKIDPASGALPRSTEWMHLKTRGQWSNLVPSWARDHSGLMNDTVASRAVIEELVAALACREASPASLTDEQIMQEFRDCAVSGEPFPGYWIAAVRRCIAAALASPQLAPALTDSQIEAGLDFEPDEQHTVADMANVGYALMHALPKGYAYNDCPSEIVCDLLNEISDLKAAAPAPVAPIKVYLVATGEIVDGLETYTRHEGAPPPLCDFEMLYSSLPTEPKGD